MVYPVRNTPGELSILDLNTFHFRKNLDLVFVILGYNILKSCQWSVKPDASRT